MTKPAAGTRRSILLVTTAIISVAGPAFSQSQGGTWERHRQTDSMSDAASESLIHSFHVDGGGRFQTTVSCAGGIINFAFDFYAANKSNDHASSLAWLENETYSATTFGFSTQINRDVRRWVPLRIRVGQFAVVSRNSSSKFTNEAEIVFYDPAEVQNQANRRAQYYASANKQPHGANHENLGQILSDLNGALGDMVTETLPTLLPLTAAGTLDQLVTAHQIKVEIPLADGRTPVVTFSPDDAALHAFLLDCSPNSGTQAGTARPGGTLEGTFADGQGHTIIFANGQAFIIANGAKSPPFTYRVSGNHVLMDDPGGDGQIELTADGGLQVTNGHQVLRFRRVR
ncbi:hypothetical protein [Acidisphaera sp. S103]|uniref:hypothetical protein n=1 Tax=Acidisphaera sp. S103 TaxID=1747223 RepID=UPI00131D5F2A|nr:hypothetical protein [Acidisphaera sp. S103]